MKKGFFHFFLFFFLSSCKFISKEEAETKKVTDSYYQDEFGRKRNLVFAKVMSNGSLIPLLCYEKPSQQTAFYEFSPEKGVRVQRIPTKYRYLLQHFPSVFQGADQGEDYCQIIGDFNPFAMSEVQTTKGKVAFFNIAGAVSCLPAILGSVTMARQFITTTFGKSGNRSVMNGFRFVQNLALGNNAAFIGTLAGLSMCLFNIQTVYNGFWVSAQEKKTIKLFQDYMSVLIKEANLLLTGSPSGFDNIKYLPNPTPEDQKAYIKASSDCGTFDSKPSCLLANNLLNTQIAKLFNYLDEKELHLSPYQLPINDLLDYRRAHDLAAIFKNQSREVEGAKTIMNQTCRQFAVNRNYHGLRERQDGNKKILEGVAIGYDDTAKPEEIEKNIIEAFHDLKALRIPVLKREGAENMIYPFFQQPFLLDKILHVSPNFKQSDVEHVTQGTFYIRPVVRRYEEGGEKKTRGYLLPADSLVPIKESCY